MLRLEKHFAEKLEKLKTVDEKLQQETDPKRKKTDDDSSLNSMTFTKL